MAIRSAEGRVAIRERTASMIVIDGKQAPAAIQQINASRSLHIFLTTAVHGAARFRFDTSSDTGSQRRVSFWDWHTGHHECAQ